MSIEYEAVATYGEEDKEEEAMSDEASVEKRKETAEEKKARRLTYLDKARAVLAEKQYKMSPEERAKNNKKQKDFKVRRKIESLLHSEGVLKNDCSGNPLQSAHFKFQKDPGDILKVIEWVWWRLDLADVRQTESPTAVHWRMLLWARTHTEEWMRTYVPKLLPATKGLVHERIFTHVKVDHREAGDHGNGDERKRRVDISDRNRELMDELYGNEWKTTDEAGDAVGKPVRRARRKKRKRES